MINVTVQENLGQSGDAAIVVFEGGPGVAGRVHELNVYVARLDDPQNWLEVTPFEVIPAGGETPEQAAQAFDAQITAYPRYEATVLPGVATLLTIEPLSDENYIQIEYLIDGRHVPGSFIPNPTPQPVQLEGRPTTLEGLGSVSSRELEVPDASFLNGMNRGSCSPGVGINMGAGAVVGTPEQFTLLTQNENARAPQFASYLGRSGFVDRTSVDWPSSGGTEGLPNLALAEYDNPANVDGQPNPGASPTRVQTCNLVTLEAGWAGP